MKWYLFLVLVTLIEAASRKRPLNDPSSECNKVARIEFGASNELTLSNPSNHNESSLLTQEASALNSPHSNRLLLLSALPPPIPPPLWLPQPQFRRP